MAAKLIDGNAYAERILQETAEKIAKFGKPSIAAVQIGSNPASESYISGQKKRSQKLGVDYRLIELQSSINQKDLHESLEELGRDDSVDGIILQMPLPEALDPRLAQNQIPPEKDVEGVTAANLGGIFLRADGPRPCTAVAALELAKSTGMELRGAECVVVGHSEIVGKPLSAMLLAEDATVTTCHVFTKNLAEHTRRADFLFVATGAAQARWLKYSSALESAEKNGVKPPAPPDLSPLVAAEMIKDGAVVIDIAVNRVPRGFDENGQPLKNKDGRIALVTVGDVDFDAATTRASYITPARGGVGPVTVAMLFWNLARAVEKRVEQ